ncbi:MAG: oxidoreductase [Leptolyngbyaceae cyanobacterium MO_188.B28]|nr:oxidoreductase [Leptolyngbyaceae cyanobacterium MO_188.B28]
MNFHLDNAPMQHGKVAIVTGANTGLGYETALGLAQKGMKVILACRSQARAEDAKTAIESAAPAADLDIMLLDLGDFSSVRRFTENFKEKYTELNLLINNAGIMWPPYSKTVDGFESQMGVNYFGHFLLTVLLIDLMPDRTDSRVVTLSSGAHKLGKGKINFEDLNWEKRYSKIDAYAQSKLACLMFAEELNRKLRHAGKKILSISAHPGVSETELGRYLSKFEELIIRVTISPFLTHSVEQAALPTLMAALDPDVKGGEYFGPQGLLEMIGQPGRATQSKYSQNQQAAKQLWDISEKLTVCELSL